MLLYNNSRPRRGLAVQIAHAYASGVHVLCCGLPLAAHFLGFGLLTAAGVGALHLWVHAHEWLFLGFSAGVFALGAGLELRSRAQKRKAGPSWLLILTASCLVINFCVILTHQASQPEPPGAALWAAATKNGS